MIKKLVLALAGLLVVLVGLVACAPLTALTAISPGADTRVAEGISYAPGPRNQLDVYAPPGASGKSPVVLFIYGGNWVSGSRAEYAFVGRALAARGFVAMVADYRLYPQVSYPDFLDDVAQAVAWTVKQAPRYGGDPQQLFVMGHSAGAYNAAMMALDPKWLAKVGLTPSVLRGWIGLAGPYDFLPVHNETTRPVFHYPNTPPESQPIKHVSAQAPAALLIAPRKDDLVDPARNTGALAARLRAAGVPVRERYYDNVGHISLLVSLAAPAQWLAPAMDEVAHFVGADGARQGP